MVEQTERQAAAPSPDIEKAKLRAIPPDLEEIFASHQRWLKTNCESGQRANLQGYNLSRFNLRGAKLSQANLQDANLEDTDFRDAVLVGVDLRNAKLAGARMQGASLQDADLTGAYNLLGKQLARTDLTKSKLPEDVGKFEDLANLAVASKNTSQIFATMLAACVFSSLTVATTSDVGLLTNSATTTLPAIGTALPILGFYVAGPILLLAVYIYFHINWARLWEGLSALPAIFPDGRRLDQVAYPWLLNGLVCRYSSCLQGIFRPFGWTQFILTVVLSWIFVPFTLILIWLRYLTRQDWLITLVMIFFLIITIWFGLRSFFLARRVLKGRDFRS